MIIAGLSDGLGNQLFQYAFARSLALAKRTALKLDVSHLREPYRLNHFNVVEDFATPEEVRRLASPSLRDRKTFMTVLLNRMRPYYLRSSIRERSFAFDSNMPRVSANAYLIGYWQTERYFRDIEPILRSEFTWKNPPDPVNSELARRVRETESVCLHVRRGDMANDPDTNAYHGTCGVEYYQHAIARLAGAVQQPHFFLFSDDPGWTRDNIHMPFPATPVTHNSPEQGHEDLRLMSLCRHFIIANSTFSWWGAWLSANPSKQVFAPKTWFHAAGLDTKDLIPESWHRI